MTYMFPFPWLKYIFFYVPRSVKLHFSNNLTRRTLRAIFFVPDFLLGFIHFFILALYFTVIAHTRSRTCVAWKNEKGIFYLYFSSILPISDHRSTTLILCNVCALQAMVCFEIRYNPPDGSCSSYAPSEIMEDEQQMLIDIEQNIANLEKSLEQAKGTSSGKRRGSWHTPEKTSKKSFLPRGTSISVGEKSPDARKRWVTRIKYIITLQFFRCEE